MVDDELTPQQRIDRARHALDLLTGEVMANAWEALTERLLLTAIRGPNPSDREIARLKVLLIDEIKRELEAFIADGELEADRLEAKTAAPAG